MQAPAASGTGGTGTPAMPAAGSGETMPGSAGAGGSATAAEPPPIACDPSDKTPAPVTFPISMISGGSNPAPIAPAKGPLKPMVETFPDFAEYTIFRPEMLDGEKRPVVVWANGGCSKNGTLFSRFLLEIASHGFVIIAYGTPNGTGMSELTTNGVPQTKAMDWAVKENERPCSPYHRKLNTQKIAAMGQSCGGLMTLGASADPRPTTVVIWNSGLLENDDKIYAGLHAPMAYFIGGESDVAYPNAEKDFEKIEKVPVFYANNPVGHLATYSQDNGGEFARVGIGWLKWQLYDDRTEAGKGMFAGADCALCKSGSMWTVKKKNME
jgi:dienelactone hydrolase